jgi:DNA repair protein RadC
MTTTIADDITISNALAILRKRMLTYAVSDVNTVRDYLQLSLGFSTTETFGVILISADNRIISIDNMFYGGMMAVAVSVRTLAVHILQSAATSCYIFHNHPTGRNNPSDLDVKLTHEIEDALAPFGVPVLDHFLVGSEVISFKSLSLMKYPLRNNPANRLQSD